MSKYINPYTDFGFKKLFGEEANKDLLIDFLNTLLPERHQIETLKFRGVEQRDSMASGHRTVLDLYCENSEGKPFIVEMQKEDQELFKDCSLYYATHPIQEQGRREKEWVREQRENEWNVELDTVYFIGILDFVYDKNDPNPVLIREVSLKDQHGKEFYGKLRMFYIQMPVFDLKASQLKTRRDKWLYFLKYLPSLEHIPVIMQEKVFQKAFLTSEVAAMDKEDRDRYESELDRYQIYQRTLETAKNEGVRKGIEVGKVEGKVDIAREMKKDGVNPQTIAKYTGLSVEEVEQLN
ncbi:MAG: Rpn family recombination-promoting nuclease/putative transposase [Planctomycetaceae bacterium]|nr:Rpn family recombination-promoting nuclease/putative transposase [Planctomycetaceae bacterium]